MAGWQARWSDECLPRPPLSALRDAPRRIALIPLPPPRREGDPSGRGCPVAVPAGSVPAVPPLCSAPKGRRGQGAEPGTPEQAAIAVCWLPPCLPRPGAGERQPSPGRCHGEMLVDPSPVPSETRWGAEGAIACSSSGPLLQNMVVSAKCKALSGSRYLGQSEQPGGQEMGRKSLPASVT